jgi:REP element-mobilizing transposase RayT
MPEKYKNKYRIPSARLQNWDYGWNGAYFITICTHNREQYFGKIINKKMALSEIGILAEKYWYEIPQHFPFVKLGEFVVMPNHIHGIIIIDKTNNYTNMNATIVETQNFASLQPPQQQYQPPLSKNKFGPQSKNLASIIRGYKIGVTKHAKKINPMWKWQSRYYDHIIRNEKSFNTITEYIINNPIKWVDDKFNTEDKR